MSKSISLVTLLSLVSFLLLAAASPDGARPTSCPACRDSGGTFCFWFEEVFGAYCFGNTTACRSGCNTGYECITPDDACPPIKPSPCLACTDSQHAWCLPAAACLGTMDECTRSCAGDCLGHGNATGCPVTPSPIEHK